MMECEQKSTVVPCKEIACPPFSPSFLPNWLEYPSTYTRGIMEEEKKCESWVGFVIRVVYLLWTAHLPLDMK